MPAGGGLQALAQQPPALTAKAWLLLDATSGQVLGAQNADVRIEPASLTKIMTAYLVFQALQNKQITLDQQVLVSERAWKVAADSSKMFIEPNTRVSVDDLISGLLIQSGNDAAIALAEAVAGSVEAFVTRMNQQAEALGLHDTHFASPHGLPSPQTYTTAREIGLLAARLQRDFPQSRKYDTTKQFTYNKITQSNRNRLLWLDPTVDGLKTGHTSSAGYCIVVSAQRPASGLQRRLISVVIGTASDKVRTQESRALLEWGYRAFDTVRLYAKGQSAGNAQVWKGASEAVKTGFANDVFLTVPAGSRIDRLEQPADTLIAPLDQGQRVGVVQVSVDGKPTVQVPVVALEPVAQAGIAGRAWDTVRLWLR
ncbi:D-alanyl-D-alanine carboxypeptidase family protein [Bordetella genomosp. 13]|uniref:D-alanyl-D-alanine carboxypeptidase family protein n=1 Tax=Bordetella genomosp. 13 TaxID=463040 RepID=UPI0021B580B9|nr:D-alanyl-D-alanine carboxypeptidase family protein [Bordetella genomosp. 13]